MQGPIGEMGKQGEGQAGIYSSVIEGWCGPQENPSNIEQEAFIKGFPCFIKGSHLE